MSEDLYTKILEIAPGERPPNYYQLLGLTLFETDRQTIHQAGKAQFMKLRPWQAHRDREVSERIADLFSLVSRACTILEVPEKKREYDQRLSDRLGVTVSIAEPEPPPVKSAGLKLKRPYRDDADLALRTCPHCGAQASSLAMLCIECGFSFETGQKLQTFIDGEAEEEVVPGLSPTQNTSTGRSENSGFARLVANCFEAAYKLMTLFLKLVLLAVVLGVSYWAFTQFSSTKFKAARPYQIDGKNQSRWAGYIDDSKEWTSLFEACERATMKGPPYVAIYIDAWQPHMQRGLTYRLVVKRPGDDATLATIKHTVKCAEHWEAGPGKINALASMVAESLAKQNPRFLMKRSGR